MGHSDWNFSHNPRHSSLVIAPGLQLTDLKILDSIAQVITTGLCGPCYLHYLVLTAARVFSFYCNGHPITRPRQISGKLQITKTVRL